MALLSGFTDSKFYQRVVEEGKPIETTVEISNGTLARLGVTLVLSFGIIIMLYFLIKAISK